MPNPVRRRLGVLLCSSVLIGGGAVAGLTAVQATAATPAPTVAAGSGTVVLVDPTRIADSRSSSALTTFAPYATEDLHFDVAPSNRVTGIVVSLTVAPVQNGLYSPGGYLEVWPTRLTRPEVSQVSFPGGQNVSNEAIIGPLDSTGSVHIFNGSPGDVDVLVDLVGYVVAA